MTDQLAPPSRPAGPAAAARLSQLADGYLSTQLLRVAAELGIADELAAGPRTAADLAAATGTDAAALHRVLRGLAADEVLLEQPGGAWALTPAGELLRRDVPGSLRGAVLARGGLYFHAAAALLGAVRGEGVPFELVHGSPFFEHLSGHPAHAAAFEASMDDRARREAAAVAQAYDAAGLRHIVDVGGGSGVLLAALLAAAPQARGVLVDRPQVIGALGDAPALAGVRDRVALAPGDFFGALPPGGDAYVLSRVLHDWDDGAALRILRAFRRAGGDGARLLVVEALSPDAARADPAAVRMDLHMLLLTTGRERTRAEFAALLAEAGYALERVVPASGVAVLEAIAVPG